MLALRTSVIAAVAGVAIGFIMPAFPDATGAPKCVLAGGEATMATDALARFMANAALENSIKGMGAKAVGKKSMACTSQLLSTHCITRQRACK